MTKDQFYMGTALKAAKQSPADGPRKTGCVIVHPLFGTLASGCNCLPKGIEFKVERVQRPGAYKWLEHAERDALGAMIRRGSSAARCIMYCTLFPCVDCARAAINAGIVRIVAPAPDMSDPRWSEDFKIALEILEAAGVEFSPYVD